MRLKLAAAASVALALLAFTGASVAPAQATLYPCAGAPAEYVAEFDARDGTVDGKVSYPEPRMFVENQSWVEPIPDWYHAPGHPGVGEQGHIHVGTCFPLWQNVSSLHLDLNMKAHNVTGHMPQLYLNGYGDFNWEVPRATWTGHPNVAWVCADVDCEKNLSLDYPMANTTTSGLHEFSVYPIAWDTNPARPDTRKWYNLPRWPVSFDNGKPPCAPASTVCQLQPMAAAYLSGDTWWDFDGGGNYARALIARADLPWDETTGELEPISGVWEPALGFEKGKGFAMVDPQLHADPPDHGTMFEWTRTEPCCQYWHRQPAIDTTLLENGVHYLLVGTSNTATFRGSPSTTAGVVKIPFLVHNACNA